MSGRFITMFVYMPLVAVAVSTIAYSAICLSTSDRRLLSVPGYVHVLRLVFMIYLSYLLMLTLSPMGNAEQTINTVPFATIKASLAGTDSEKLNLLLNIAAFVPFGFLFSAAFNRNGRMGLTILAGFAVTCTIEIAQGVLPVFRVFDVDDILLNTIGCAIGCAVCAARQKHSAKSSAKMLQMRAR